jgi:hypothetical protein
VAVTPITKDSPTMKTFSIAIAIVAVAASGTAGCFTDTAADGTDIAASAEINAKAKTVLTCGDAKQPSLVVSLVQDKKGKDISGSVSFSATEKVVKGGKFTRTQSAIFRYKSNFLEGRKNIHLFSEPETVNDTKTRPIIMTLTPKALNAPVPKVEIEVEGVGRIVVTGNSKEATLFYGESGEYTFKGCTLDAGSLEFPDSPTEIVK